MQMIRLTLTLTIIALLAGLSIGYTNGKTADIIAEQKVVNQTNALASLFPSGTEIKEDTLLKASDTIPFWIGVNGDSTIGYVLKTGETGYSSYISLLAAVTPQNRLLGISILSQEETPGLGSRTTETISTQRFPMGLWKKGEKGAPWFQEQFKELSLASPVAISAGGEWHKLNDTDKKALQTNNEVSSISGATISTKAVCDALAKISPLVDEINAYLAQKEVN